MPVVGTIYTLADGETVDAARLNSNFTDIKAVLNTYAVLTDVVRNITVSHTWTAAQTFTGGVSGPGAGLTALNASNLASGTVASARVAGAYSGITGVGVLASLDVTGNFAINTNKFTVAGASGNTLIAGTLGLTGLLTAPAGWAGDFGPSGTPNAALAANVLTFNWDLGNSMYWGTALAANTAIVLTVPTHANGRVYRGMVFDPNGKIVTFTTTVRWIGSAPPATAMTAGKAFVFVIWYVGVIPFGQWGLEV